MSGSAAENQLKAGMSSGKNLLGGNDLLGGENLLGRRKISKRKAGPALRLGGLPLAGLGVTGLGLAGLRGWLALPRDLALGRLAYHLKRPLFALPQAPWHWRGNPPATAALVPPDPWPGNAQRGAAILEDSYHFLGRSLTKPAPLWNPVGVERAWLEALHGFSWLRDLRAAGGDAARRKVSRAAAWAPVCVSSSAILPRSTGSAAPSPVLSRFACSRAALISPRQISASIRIKAASGEAGSAERAASMLSSIAS